MISIRQVIFKFYLQFVAIVPERHRRVRVKSVAESALFPDSRETSQLLRAAISRSKIKGNGVSGQKLKDNSRRRARVGILARRGKIGRGEVSFHRKPLGNWSRRAAHLETRRASASRVRSGDEVVRPRTAHRGASGAYTSGRRASLRTSPELRPES